MSAGWCAACPRQTSRQSALECQALEEVRPAPRTRSPRSVGVRAGLAAHFLTPTFGRVHTRLTPPKARPGVGRECRSRPRLRRPLRHSALPFDPRPRSSWSEAATFLEDHSGTAQGAHSPGVGSGASPLVATDALRAVRAAALEGAVDLTSPPQKGPDHLLQFNLPVRQAPPVRSSGGATVLRLRHPRRQLGRRCFDHGPHRAPNGTANRSDHVRDV